MNAALAAVAFGLMIAAALFGIASAVGGIVAADESRRDYSRIGGAAALRIFGALATGLGVIGLALLAVAFALGGP